MPAKDVVAAFKRFDKEWANTRQRLAEEEDFATFDSVEVQVR